MAGSWEQRTGGGTDRLIGQSWVLLFERGTVSCSTHQHHANVFAAPLSCSPRSDVFHTHLAVIVPAGPCSRFYIPSPSQMTPTDRAIRCSNSRV